MIVASNFFQFAAIGRPAFAGAEMPLPAPGLLLQFLAACPAHSDVFIQYREIQRNQIAGSGQAVFHAELFHSVPGYLQRSGNAPGAPSLLPQFSDCFFLFFGHFQPPRRNEMRHPGQKKCSIKKRPQSLTG